MVHEVIFQKHGHDPVVTIGVYYDVLGQVLSMYLDKRLFSITYKHIAIMRGLTIAIPCKH